MQELADRLDAKIEVGCQKYRDWENDKLTSEQARNLQKRLAPPLHVLVKKQVTKSNPLSIFKDRFELFWLIIFPTILILGIMFKSM